MPGKILSVANFCKAVLIKQQEGCYNPDFTDFLYKTY
jgi:hypothetical protein